MDDRCIDCIVAAGGIAGYRKSDCARVWDAKVLVCTRNHLRLYAFTIDNSILAGDAGKLLVRANGVKQKNSDGCKKERDYLVEGCHPSLQFEQLCKISAEDHLFLIVGNLGGENIVDRIRPQQRDIRAVDHLGSADFLDQVPYAFR